MKKLHALADTKGLSTDFHLVWIYDGSLNEALDAATWLETVEQLRDSGWNVTLAAAGPAGLQRIHGVEILGFSRPQIYLLGQAVFHLRVLNFILRHFGSIDVILFHEVSAPWLFPLRILRVLAKRRLPLLVMDTRSLPMMDPGNETFKERLRRDIYRGAIQLGDYSSDGRLAITQRMVEAVKIPTQKRWGTWPSGVDIEHFSAPSMVRDWPKADGPVHLIYHGSMHYERNLMTLSRAVVEANAEKMAFLLSLVGEGRQRAELEQFATKSGGAVRVLPAVPYEEIPKILANAHVGVLPFPDEQKFRVSSPIKLFEYMASRLPILATRVVCHTDVVGAGEYVFWAEDATQGGLLDALRSVWRSRAILSEMGQRAAQDAGSWTWKSSAKKLKTAIEKGYQPQKLPLGANSK